MARKRTTKALTHKTNWGLNDTVLPEDFNRIEGNIKQNEANQNTANSNHTALAARVSKTESDISKNKTDISTANSNHTALANRVTTAEGTINKNKNDIATANNNHTVLAGRVTTAENNINTANSNHTALATRVTTAEGNINTTNEKIDNLKIGGRNYYLNTTNELKEVSFSGWQYYFGSITIGENLKVGDTITASCFINPNKLRSSIMIHITKEDGSFYQKISSIWIEPQASGYAIVTCDIPNGASSVKVALRHDSGSAPSDNLFYKELKLEKGNKATDWTQAPEDIQKQIDKNKNDIITANSNHTALTNRVTMAEGDITNISKKINNLKIGGRNFIQLKKLESYIPYNSIKVIGNIIETVIERDALPNLAIKVTGYIPKNEVYTVSGIAKLNGNPISKDFFKSNKASTHSIGESIITVDNNGYFTITETWRGDSGWIFHCGIGAVTGDKVTFENLNFERGNIASDVTPAPEDVQADINENKNDIATANSNYKALAGRVTTAESNITKNKNDIAAANTNHSNLVKEYNKTKEQANDWDSFKKNGGTVSNKVAVTNGTNTTDYKPEGIYSNREAFNFKAGDGDNGMFISQSGLNPTGPMNLGSASRSWESIYLTGRSVTANGYIKLPNGMVLQWGTNKTAANVNAGYLNYNIAFPTTCVSVIATPQGGVAEICTQGYTDTSFAWNMNVSGRWFTWIALGY